MVASLSPIAYILIVLGSLLISATICWNIDYEKFVKKESRSAGILVFWGFTMLMTSAISVVIIILAEATASF